jgi:hypothetical protein
MDMANMTDLQLVISFSLAGSDNIAAHISQMGWHKSARYSKKNIKDDLTAENFVAKRTPLPNLVRVKNASPELVAALKQEITKKLEQFGWFPGVPLTAEIDAPEQETTSELANFAFEMKSGKLLRPKIAKLAFPECTHLLDARQVRSINRLLGEASQNKQEHNVLRPRNGRFLIDSIESFWLIA